MTWADPRCAIWLFSERADADKLLATAISSGARSTEIDLQRIHSQVALLDVFTARFHIPYPMGGVDGAIDWLSDLEWLPPSTGQIVIFNNVDTTEPEVRDVVAAIGPFVLDRWRETLPPTPYAYVLICDQSRETVLEWIADGNRRLAEGALRRPGYIAPIPVLDHVS